MILKIRNSDCDFATFITNVGIELKALQLDAHFELVPDYSFHDIRINIRFNRVKFEYSTLLNYNTWLYEEAFESWKRDLLLRIQREISNKIYTEEKECELMKYSNPKSLKNMLK